VRDEPETDRLVKLVAEAKMLGAERVTVTGGEPCLMPGLGELAEACLSSGLRLHISTSGVGLDAALLHRLAEAHRGGPPIEITVSIDTIQNELAQQLGRPPVSSAVRALEVITEWGWPFSAGLNAVVTRMSIGGLVDVADLCESMGVYFGVQELSPSSRSGSGVHCDLALTGEQAELSESILLELLARRNAKRLSLGVSDTYLARVLGPEPERNRVCPAVAFDRICVDVDLGVSYCWFTRTFASLERDTLEAALSCVSAEGMRQELEAGICPGCSLRCYER
jgi:MoaA/NifB/PqqE/SkfB family radical SAM enzyme